MTFKPFLNLLFTSVLLFGIIHSNAQNPNRFKEQVEELVQKEHHFEPGKKMVLFTGSSIVRMWKDVQDYFPETKVIFISPKPSIARKHLKKKYERLNRRLERYCNRKENLEFADVWHSMLAKNGEVYEDIFIDDGLHMNKKGYDIWGKILVKFLE